MAPKQGLPSRGAALSVIRTPFLLVLFPGILVAVLLASMILGVATAASPLFLSSASTAAIRQITATSINVPAISLSTYAPIFEDVADFRDQKLTALTRRIDELGPPIETVVGGRQNLTNTAAPRATGPESVLAWRTGAEDHIEFVAGGPGEGVWIADTVAKALQLEVGDTVSMGTRPDVVESKVAGIYRTLAPLPRDDYWAPVAGLVYPINPNAPAPPPLLLAPKHEFFRLESVLSDQGQFRWEFPLRPGDITLPEARRLSAGIANVIGEVNNPTSEVGSNFQRPASNSPVPQLVERAVATVTALTGPVDTLAIAGRAVAFAVVAAAGLFLVTRRRVEYTWYI